MEYDKLTIRILNRLDLNIQPSANLLDVSSEELKNKLYEMKADKLVTFDVIKDSMLFNGEARKVEIIDKGRLVLNENRDKIDIP